MFYWILSMVAKGPFVNGSVQLFKMQRYAFTSIRVGLIHDICNKQTNTILSDLMDVGFVE